jgi:hypothetical protein
LLRVALALVRERGKAVRQSLFSNNLHTMTNADILLIGATGLLLLAIVSCNIVNSKNFLYQALPESSLLNISSPTPSETHSNLRWVPALSLDLLQSKKIFILVMT